MNLPELTWPEVDQLPRTTPVVFPIAALEQHGRHMPLFTDSLLLGEVVRRVQQHAEMQQILFAPLQWLGNSHHHLDLAGTLSASPRVYLDLLHDLVESLLRHGFERFLFLNGHGGNAVPGQQVIFELRQKYRNRPRLLFSSLTYWDAARPDRSDLLQQTMGHACEWETSMMLVIRPDLVKQPVAAVPEQSFGLGTKPAARGWIMPDRSEHGHVGMPAAATVVKGEYLFETFAAGVVDYLQRMARWNGESWDL